MQLGVYTESFNLSWFEQQSGLEVERDVAIYHPEFDYFVAHLDGRIAGSRTPVECKHTNSFNRDVAERVSLIQHVHRKMMRYQLQDIRCSKTNVVATHSLARVSKSSAEFKLAQIESTETRSLPARPALSAVLKTPAALSPH